MLNQKQIKKLKKLNIGIVYLFGSFVDNLQTENSDIDIGIIAIKQIKNNKTRNKTYIELYEIFSNIFKKRNIDLVFLDRTNLELKFDVIKHSKVLYEISSEFRLDFEEKINIMYVDFKPILNEFNNAIIGNI